MRMPWGRSKSGFKRTIGRAVGYQMRNQPQKKSSNRQTTTQPPIKPIHNIQPYNKPVYESSDDELFDMGYVRLLNVFVNNNSGEDIENHLLHRGYLCSLDINSQEFSWGNDEMTAKTVDKVNFGFGESIPIHPFELKYRVVCQSAHPREELGLDYPLDAKNKLLIIRYTHEPNRDITVHFEMKAEYCDRLYQQIKPLVVAVSSCFVATAVYNSNSCVEVERLRQWRDSVLAKSFIGRKFISFYYKHGEKFAKFVSRHKLIKAFIRHILDAFTSRL